MAGGGSTVSGGGSSGRVDFPSYMKEVHKELLASQGDTDPSSYAILDDGVSVLDATQAAWGNGPYEGLAAFDPANDLDAMQTRFDTYDAAVTLLSDLTNWQAFFDKAMANIEEDEELTWEQAAEKALKFVDKKLIPDKYISDVVEKFECDRRSTLAASRSRFNAGMADVDCVMNSAFLIGQSMLELFHQREVDKFDADLRFKAHQDRVEFVRTAPDSIREFSTRRWGYILQAITQMAKMQDDRIRAQYSAATLQTEISKMTIAAQVEQTNTDAQFDEKEAVWDLELFQYGANVLGAIGGGSTVYKQQGQSGGTNWAGWASTAASAASVIAAVW